MAYSTKTIAEGCFGKVYKEKHKDTWAALKRVPVGFINKYDLERECRVYDNARHPNVVKLLDKPWIKDGKWNIPLEFIFGEDLETTIFKTQSSKILLTPAVRATIITGMCEGLYHLHSKDIVHQDLKPDNIMIEHQTHRAVIIDLGLAKFSKNGLSSAANLGNEAYSAPEILQICGVRDKRSDVWAMGKLIAELCARIRLPTQYVCADKIEEYLKDQPYSNYCKTVSRMVETKPCLRASMAGVILDIRSASSIVQAENKSRDVTAPQRNEKKEIPSSPRFQPPSLQAPTFTKTEARIPPKTEPRTHPILNYHRNPLQPKEMEKAVVPLKGAGFNNPLMSFPCPLPNTGKVTHQHYNEAKGVLEFKEIITKDGKVTKYEKVQITKNY